ncbi:hypothetical protein AAG906_039295 [Vitis piasezkii]
MLELQRQPIAEGVVAMTEAEICERVLGQKSGYTTIFGVKLSWSIDLLRLNYLWRLNNNNLRLNKIELTNWRPWYKNKTNNIINNLKKYCVIYDQAKGPHDPFFYDVHMMDAHFFFLPMLI